MANHNLLIKKSLSLGAFLNLCMSIYTRFFFQCIALGTLFYALPQFSISLIGNFNDHEIFGKLAIIFLMIAANTGYVLTIIILIRAVSQLCVGEIIEWKSIFFYSSQNLFRICWTQIVLSFWCIVCFLCFIIPGLIAKGNTSQVIPVMLIENCHFKMGWKRSLQLFPENRWRVMIITSTYSAIYLLVFLLEVIPGTLIENYDPSNRVVISFSIRIFEVLTYALFPIFYTLLYFDIRVRNEGSNLKVQNNNLETSPSLYTDVRSNFGFWQRKSSRD